MLKKTSTAERIREKLDQLLEIHGDAQLVIESTYGALEAAPRAAKQWLEEVTGYQEPEDSEEEWP